MRRLSAVLLILFGLAAISAAPRPDDLSKKFLGAWRLVSIEGNPPGRTNLYDRPTGQILYAASGHMCVNIVFKPIANPSRLSQKDCSSLPTRKKPPLTPMAPISARSLSMPKREPSLTTLKTISSPAERAPTTSAGSRSRALTAFSLLPSKTAKAQPFPPD